MPEHRLPLQDPRAQLDIYQGPYSPPKISMSKCISVIIILYGKKGLCIKLEILTCRNCPELSW